MKNKREKKSKGNAKSKKSLRTMIMLIIGLAIIGTSLLNYFTVIPSVTENYKKVTKQYVYDVTSSYGQLVNKLISQTGGQLLSLDYGKQLLGSIHINGQESSYAYVVSKEGTILYDPDKTQIGQPIQIDAISDIVSKLAAGESYETQVIEYSVDGQEKYAGIYADQDNGNLFVVVTDKSDALSFIDTIRTRTIMGSLGTFLLFCIISYLFVLIFIIKPITILTSYLQKIGQMDFSEDIVSEALCKREDETGLMARNVESLRIKLVDVITSIKNNSTELYKTSEDLDNQAVKTAVTVEQVEKAVLEIADGASSQAEDTTKATENVVLMGNMVEETNEIVHTLQKNSENMKTVSDDAKDQLKQLEDINRKAKESIGEINQQTHTTNESALQIREATNIITSIAEETNLLSLNASIEAARAGEQGRGFAVVAAQIQKLAEQSNSSARQIESIIDLLIQESEKAVETMNRVTDIMTIQNETVQTTANTFEKVQIGIDQSLDSVQIIADKTARLDQARESVVDVVQNLTAIAEENAATTEETSASTTEVGNAIEQVSAAADKLISIAKQLDHRMQDFKF